MLPRVIIFGTGPDQNLKIFHSENSKEFFFTEFAEKNSFFINSYLKNRNFWEIWMMKMVAENFARKSHVGEMHYE